MNTVIVQKGTIDEFPIKYYLEGNINSKNLLVMIHGGGMDHHEKGQFMGLINGKPEKEMKDDGKLHTKLYTMPYGNYDRIVAELLIDNIDTAIVRIDLRNHGKSVAEKEDMRDTSIERMARDVSCVIDQLVDLYNYENIHLFGTCMGGLVSQCYATGIGSNEYETMKNRTKLKSLTLDCSLSFENLFTNDVEDRFNYIKCQKILNTSGFQFHKMNGVYEGINTVKEAQKNGNIAFQVGNLNIPILYIYGSNDRMVLPRKSLELASSMLAVNDKVIIKVITEINHGFADHCLYDPQSSDALVVTAVPFLETQINNEIINIKRER